MRGRRSSLRAALIAAVALAGATACSSPAEVPPAASRVSRTAWYLDCWRHYNTKNFEAFGACYSDQATSSRVDSTLPDSVSRAAIVALSKKEAETFPDRAGEVSLVLANGPHIVSLALFHGTHTGPMAGANGTTIPASGRRFGVPAAHRAEFDASGAMVIRDWFYLDEGTMASQLGLAPMPARAAAQPSGRAPIVVESKGDAIERRNVDAARSLMAAVSAGDLEAIERVSAPSYRLMEVGRPADLDLAQTIAAIREVRIAFPDARWTLDDVWGAGEYVVLTGQMEGTNAGDWPSMGIKKTGRSVRSRFLEVLRFADGRITEDWLYYNSAALAAQLTPP